MPQVHIPFFLPTVSQSIRNKLSILLTAESYWEFTHCSLPDTIQSYSETSLHEISECVHLLYY